MIIPLLDYFAVHASEEDLKDYIPRTVGETRDLLIKLGIIPSERRSYDALSSYSNAEARMLRPWARYQHAKAMMKARQE